MRAPCASPHDVRGMDVELEEADNAASAVGVLERETPDVVVLDVRMPGMDGIELCRRIGIRARRTLPSS